MVRWLDDGDANEKAGTTTTTCTRVLRRVGVCRERRRYGRVWRQSSQRDFGENGFACFLREISKQSQIFRLLYGPAKRCGVG